MIYIFVLFYVAALVAAMLALCQIEMVPSREVSGATQGKFCSREMLLKTMFFKNLSV